ncbi:fructosamine kinase family protein [Rubripirellula reticaptiva]|uniref:Fructosamine kinase n=1 Tax=Rubripirellula reticaptiva TaxID=2528013 RepID=A0A5C6FA84_9BACT|nr:fructosamine kinase family protein [Rubripirellula reticaptiva]TWU57712.1 Fructosamine kinase [Rubripirellula reticaptiva]
MPASDIESSLRQLLPSIVTVANMTLVGGGCISDAVRVEVRLRDETVETVIVKSNDASFADNFECERDGLSRLRAADAIGVPEVLASGVIHGRAWLVTQWIEPGKRGTDFFAKFGRSLASLHRSSLGTRIGLDRDNYIGSTRQWNSLRTNSSQSCWPEFVADQRIRSQLKCAVDQGLASSQLRQDTETIINRMEQLLAGREDATSLLHGDLWSGNYPCDAVGQPVIIDPAIYYGCREAEFGMLRLFGSCPNSFYDAYNDAFPLAAGWQRRTGVYVLYHLMNHLNMFGVGYLDQCQSTASNLLS